MTVRAAAGFGIRATILGLAISTGAHAGQRADDAGKKACVVEARRLCPAEMRTFSRKKVEACMIAKIDQTSPACHAAMLQIKADREGASGGGR